MATPPDPIGAALEAQIRENPEDWERWLVYADYLTEQRDERGRLIQLEHRLRSTRGAARQALEREIVKLKGPRWRRWHEGWERPEGVEATWRHGFLSGVTFSGTSLQTIAALSELSSHPVARLLVRATFPALAERELGQVIGLLPKTHLRRLNFAHLRRGIEALLRAPALARLEAVTLERCTLDRGALDALAQSEPLRALPWLTLRWCLDEDGQPLPESRRLRSLDVPGLRQHDEDTLVLAHSTDDT